MVRYCFVIEFDKENVMIIDVNENLFVWFKDVYVME